MTITIKGVCSEAVDDVPGGVTIQAAAPGDGLSAPNSSANPVLGISGGGVMLTGLTISGGVDPLLVHKTGGVTGTNLVITGGSTYDVLDSGGLTLINSTIENSANEGIASTNGGSVILDGGTVQNNPNWGLEASSGGSIAIDEGAVITGNGTLSNSQGVPEGGGVLSGGNGYLGFWNGVVENNTGGSGILLYLGGSARLGRFMPLAGDSVLVQNNAGDGVTVVDGWLQVRNSTTVVSGNSGNGIGVYGGGRAVLQTNAVVQSNAKNGIAVTVGSVQIGSGAGPATIQSNTQNGVFLTNNSVANFGNSQNQIVNNGQWGILCAGAPNNPLASGAFGTISGNPSGQNNCNP
ncbi:MAG TPA: right-handed parallel beta-helix repeat-containing protein [Stellaceae bacterium]|nr:right-handed parallel beta-helix repeat-containing protein [Stellaceae bacterium]